MCSPLYSLQLLLHTVLLLMINVDHTYSSYYCYSNCTAPTIAMYLPPPVAFNVVAAKGNIVAFDIDQSVLHVVSVLPTAASSVVLTHHS